MRFENVSILIDKLRDIIRDMKYCWVDDHGVIQLQDGVFRVNCIDCLDRTNIVQTAIARTVMDLQVSFSNVSVLSQSFLSDQILKWFSSIVSETWSSLS